MAGFSSLILTFLTWYTLSYVTWAQFNSPFKSLTPCVKSCFTKSLPRTCDDEVACICSSVDWTAISECACSKCDVAEVEQEAFPFFGSSCGDEGVDVSLTCPPTSSTQSSTTQTKTTKTRTITTTTASRTEAPPSVTDTDTDTDTPSSDVTPVASPSSTKGLSASTKAGIGVGSSVGAAAIIAFFLFLFRRHIHQSWETHEQGKEEKALAARASRTIAKIELDASPPERPSRSIKSFQSFHDNEDTFTHPHWSAIPGDDIDINQLRFASALNEPVSPIETMEPMLKDDTTRHY